MLFAIVVIIYLLTVDFGANDDLVKYLGFGLTITSIFVGLVAIAQAFLSGNSINKTIGILDKSSQDMITTTTDVKLIIQTLQEKVEQIPKQLNDFSEKLDSRLIRTEIEKIDSSNVSKNPEIDKKQIIEFLHNSSVNGVFAIYTATKAFDTDKKFDLNYLFSGSNLIFPRYQFAYIVAGRSLKIYNADYDGTNIGITDSKINSKEVHTILIGKINKPNFKRSKDELLTVLNKVDEYFQQ